MTKQNLQLQFVREQTEVEKQIDQIDKDTMLAETVTPSFDRTVCPKCKNGRMIVIEEIPRIRSPPRLHAEPVEVKYKHLIKAYLKLSIDIRFKDISTKTLLIL